MTKRAPGTGSTVLAQPMALPCGLVLPNRIMKAAMGEGLANPNTSDVTPALIRLYERWADGGAGTLITGVLNTQRGIAPRLRQVTSVPLALTGGLRSRVVMEGLIRDGVVDAVGLARPLVEHPTPPGGC